MLQITNRISGLIIAITVLILFYSYVIAKAIHFKERIDGDLEIEISSCAEMEFEETEEDSFLSTPYYIENIDLDEDILKFLYDTCKDYQVDYKEALAIMKTENPKLDIKLRHKNTNGTIDYGLFQINSCNHGWLGQVLQIDDFLDPYQNIHAGVYMISDLGKKYHGHKKYMAYNMGENGMAKYVNLGGESTNYSRKVKQEYDKLKEIISNNEDYQVAS